MDAWRFGVGLVVAIGIGACAADGPETSEDEADLAASGMVGDFHLRTRSLDEAFAFDGAMTELTITRTGGACRFEALQAKGGCSATKLCSSTKLLSSDEHAVKVAGTCSSKGAVLTLDTPSGPRAFRVASAKVKGTPGWELRAADGKALNKAGASAFFEKTSRDPGEALARAHAGGSLPALSRSVDPKDPALPAPVRAGLAKLVTELSKDKGDISRSVDEVFAVLATPFDATPVAYAVSASHSGDHCGGYQVFAVDAAGKRIATELSDGDCGL